MSFLTQQFSGQKMSRIERKKITFRNRIEQIFLHNRKFYF